MAAHSSSGAGGPLLRVADMLKDLAEDNLTSKPVVRTTLLTVTPSPSSSAQNSKGLEKQDLPGAFEETYHELTKALTQSGHPWTGLTQELCATLTTADKLVATSQLNLGQLSQEVRKLEKIVARGQGELIRLQTAIGQVNDKVLVS